MSLKLVSVNIEQSKHLDLVRTFLEKEKPDIICMQELMEHDLDYFRTTLGDMVCVFEPMGAAASVTPPGVMGVGVYTRIPLVAHDVRYYVGAPGILPPPCYIDDSSTYNNFNRMVLIVQIRQDNTLYRVGTTHGVWTPNGSMTDDQKHSFTYMLEQLTDTGDMVLTGDFNAPRMFPDGTAGEAFGMIATKYKDNIPAQYTTSIDGSLHRAGALPYMVDGLFSTPQYAVSDVMLHAGVSDHCAITATISRTVNAL